LKFFIDECLSPHLAEILSRTKDASDIDEFIPAESKFQRGTKDEEYIPKLEREGNWVVITCDCGGGEASALAWKITSLTVIILSREYARADIRGQTWRLVKHWPNISRKVHAFPTNARFRVGANGNITRI
jgi:predicted nuclease of predicted toxin-antitoxin system